MSAGRCGLCLSTLQLPQVPPFPLAPRSQCDDLIAWVLDYLNDFRARAANGISALLRSRIDAFVGLTRSYADRIAALASGVGSPAFLDLVTSKAREAAAAAGCADLATCFGGALKPALDAIGAAQAAAGGVAGAARDIAAVQAAVNAATKALQAVASVTDAAGKPITPVGIVTDIVTSGKLTSIDALVSAANSAQGLPDAITKIKAGASAAANLAANAKAIDNAKAAFDALVASLASLKASVAGAQAAAAVDAVAKAVGAAVLEPVNAAKALADAYARDVKALFDANNKLDTKGGAVTYNRWADFSATDVPCKVRAARAARREPQDRSAAGAAAVPSSLPL